MKVYKILSILTSLLFFYLFYTLMFDVQGLCSSLGLEGNEVSDFLAKRASMLMLGFGVLLLVGANVKASACQVVISMGVAVCMLGLGTMSGYEYFRGFVNSGMLPPMIVELVLGVAFLVSGLFGMIGGKYSAERGE